MHKTYKNYALEILQLLVEAFFTPTKKLNIWIVWNRIILWAQLNLKEIYTFNCQVVCSLMFSECLVDWKYMKAVLRCYCDMYKCAMYTVSILCSIL